MLATASVTCFRSASIDRKGAAKVRSQVLPASASFNISARAMQAGSSPSPASVSKAAAVSSTLRPFDNARYGAPPEPHGRASMAFSDNATDL